MLIHSVSFDKKDFFYNFKFFDNHNENELSTNEEALQSFTDRIAVLTAAVKNYLQLPEDWNAKIINVTYGDKTKTITVNLQSREDWRKSATIKTSVMDISEREKEPKQDRIVLLEEVEKLYIESENYLTGHRAQKQLDL